MRRYVYNFGQKAILPPAFAEQILPATFAFSSKNKIIGLDFGPTFFAQQYKSDAMATRSNLSQRDPHPMHALKICSGKVQEIIDLIRGNFIKNERLALQQSRLASYHDATQRRLII